MATTSRGYPYPSDYAAASDGPAALQALAEAVNTDVDARAVAHAQFVTWSNNADTAMDARIRTLEAHKLWAGSVSIVGSGITVTGKITWPPFDNAALAVSVIAVGAAPGTVATISAVSASGCDVQLTRADRVAIASPTALQVIVMKRS